MTQPPPARTSPSPASESAATNRNSKLLFCSFIGCSGNIVRPDSSCFVYGSSVRSSCFSAISLGQNVTSNNIYCSAQCICYDQDSNISNNDVQSRRLALLENNKLQLRSLAHSLGVKISYRPPGQASKDLSKEGIVQRILEKQFMNDLATAGVDESAAATPPATEVPSVVTIHDNFRLVNVMFCTEITEISNQCRSAATRNELDTNMVGANSPFWNKVSSLFNAISACDPNSDGVDFLNKVHFNHTFYNQHHEEINPSNQGKFSNQKLKAMWSKIKSDYDLAFTNFTKSGNHYSSFTVAAMREFRRQERDRLRASDTSGGVNDSSSCLSNDDNDDDEVEEDTEGIGDKGFTPSTNICFVQILLK